MADGLISIRSFDLGDDFPVGHKLGELGHGKRVGILNANKGDEDAGNIFPDVLPGEGERFPIGCRVGEIELGERNVQLTLRISTSGKLKKRLQEHEAVDFHLSEQLACKRSSECQ